MFITIIFDVIAFRIHI